MILRLTKKTMNKIKSKVFDLEPSRDYQLPLSEWYINHFKLGHKGYFIITESKSLYSIIEPSVGISSQKIFKDRIISLLRKLELESNLTINSIDTTEVYICKTNNRSVLGSQNDLIRMAEAIFYYDDVSNKDLSKINETPMSYTKSFPDKDIEVEIKRRRDF